MPARKGSFADQVMRAFRAVYVMTETSVRDFKMWGTQLREDVPLYASALTVVSLALQTFAVAEYYTSRGLSSVPSGDAAIFQHTGWYIANGGRLYLDIWEVKPPVPYEILAVLALPVGDNVLTHHLLSVAITQFALFGSVLLIGALVHQMTEDTTAAILAGLSLFVLRGMAFTAAGGFKAKYFSLVFGLGAIYLMRRNHYVSSGALGAAAAGCYQIAVFFPAAVFVQAIDAGRRETALTIVGGVILIALSLLPIVYWGATKAMIAQVVLIPQHLASTTPLLALPDLVLKGVRHLGYGVPVFIAGVAGLYATARDFEDRWWVAFLGAGFMIQILFLDYEGHPDLILLLGVVGIGVGLLISEFETTGKATFGGLVVFAVLIAVVFGAGPGVFITPTDEGTPLVNSATLKIGSALDTPSVDTGPDPITENNESAVAAEFGTIDTYYRNAEIPDSCWYTYHDSSDLRGWVRYIGASEVPNTCHTYERLREAKAAA